MMDFFVDTGSSFGKGKNEKMSIVRSTLTHTFGEESLMNEDSASGDYSDVWFIFNIYYSRISQQS